MNTGEDNEDSVYVNRAKLFQYHPDTSSWKERGIGPIKINVERSESGNDGDSDAKDLEAQSSASSNSPVKARLLMRNHATHKVILNSPIFREMKVNEQAAKQLLIVCPNETGALTTYMLRVRTLRRHLIYDYTTMDFTDCNIDG